MPSSISRRLAHVATIVATVMLAACAVPKGKPAPEPAPVASAPVAVIPPPPSVMPVEAEPFAPATQPGGFYSQQPGPVGAMLAYADKVRQLSPPELTNELNRLAELGDTPTVQMQTAIVLAQTRSSADLVKAIGVLQRVSTNPAAEALPLQPLARVLSARYTEQRRVEEDRDKQAQQVRDSQRRIDQLNDRIEALRAIERSFTRPNAAPASTPAPANNSKPAQ